jgi:hypothetical protein
LTIVSGSPPAQGPLQPLHAGVDDNEMEIMQPSGAARLFQDVILQAAATGQTTAAGQTTTAGQTITAAEQSTTATGQLGNSAASTTVTGQSHEVGVDVSSIAAFQNHRPAHIVATVNICHGG